MMKYTLINKKNEMLNLGTKNGKMLNFAPESKRVISEELFNTFSFEIERAMNGNLLEVEKEDPKPEPKLEPKPKSKSKTKKSKKKKVKYDLNNDGVFDEKDKSIAGKVLSHKK